MLESNYSAEVSAMASDTLAPDQVTGVNHTVNQGSVDLTWSAVTTSELITDTFSGDGSTTTFQLNYVDVAVGTDSITVDGTVQVRDTDYTIDEVNGTITFTIAPASGTDNIVVEYKKNLSDLAGYYIYRKETSGGSFTQIDSVAAGTTSYTDNTALDGATYFYAISAYDDEATPNEGVKSADHQVNTIPSVPQNLTATAFDGKIKLDWDSVQDGGQPKLNENLAGYNIYRSTTSGYGYTNIGNTTTGTVTFEDSSVTNGTTYYYVVTAYDNTP